MGIILLIVLWLAKVFANIILFGQDSLARADAINKGNISYTDHNGSSRYTTTGERFSATELPNGHWVWTNDKMQVIRDLSQESIDRERRENYEFAIRNGLSTYLWMNPKWGQRTADAYGKTYRELANLFKDPNEVRHRSGLPSLYRDVKTGQIYVVKELYFSWYKLINELAGTDIQYIDKLNRRYFVNPKTNEVVRAVDDVCLNKFERTNLTQEQMNLINRLTREKNMHFFIRYDTFERDIYWEIRRKEEERLSS